MRKREYLDLDDDDYVLRDGESVRVPVFLTDAVTFDENHRPHFVRASDAQRAAVNDARDQMIRRAENAWRTRDANPPQFTCPECHGTGKDPDGDSPDDECDECGGLGSIPTPNMLSSSQRRDPGRYPNAALHVDRRRRPPDDDDDDDADDARRRRRRRSDDARSIADAKRAAYESYCAKIRDAWRTPTRDAGQPDNSSPPEVMRRFLHGGDEPDHDAPAMLRRHLQTEGNEENQRRRDRAWQDYRDRLGSAWQRGRSDPKEADRIMRQAASENWKHGAA